MNQVAVEDALSFFDTMPEPTDPAWRNGLKTAYHEALRNALEHGSPGHPERIKVRYRTRQGRFQVMVADGGKGFAPNPALPPEMGVEPSAERGRGLLFIEHFTTRHWWNRIGNVLFLELALPATEGGAGLELSGLRSLADLAGMALEGAQGSRVRAGTE